MLSVKRLGILSLLFASACGSSAPPTNGPLGINSYEVTESATELRIVGLADGVAKAQALLELGTFQIPDDGRTAAGRRLTVSAGGPAVEHVSEGTPQLKLPMPVMASPAVRAFLAAPEVSSPLARWGVNFDSANLNQAPPQLQQSSDEIAYGGCHATSSGSSYPYGGCGTCTHGFSASCGESSCGQFTAGSGEDHEFVACDGTALLIERSCTTYPGTSDCGTNGPAGGCAVCWSQSYGDCGYVDGFGGYCNWHNGIWYCGDVPC